MEAICSFETSVDNGRYICCMPHIATMACGLGMVERILVGWVPDDWSSNLK
jgi:hypothetical protein